MLTLYGLGTIPSSVIGYNRDLRVEWALEEIGIPYHFHGVNFRLGEQRSAEFRELSPFQLVPVIVDDGICVSESGAILLYLAEKHGMLIPSDFHGRIQVTQWCFSILNTLEKKLQEILVLNLSEGSEENLILEMKTRANRWLEVLNQRLETQSWIAHQDFSVADILLATVLRGIYSSGLIEDYPHIKEYMRRAFDRPAWKRALANYSDRTGKPITEMQI